MEGQRRMGWLMGNIGEEDGGEERETKEDGEGEGGREERGQGGSGERDRRKERVR
jgi:hypothetical protein